MLKKGKRSFTYRVLPISETQGIQHELSGDAETTKFRVTEQVTDEKYVAKHYPDGNPVVAYILVTVFANVPLNIGDKIRFLDYNDLSFFQLYNAKKKQYQMFYSISARIEIVAKKEKKTKKNT
jgi:hypothetical protein